VVQIGNTHQRGNSTPIVTDGTLTSPHLHHIAQRGQMQLPLVLPFNQCDAFTASAFGADPFSQS